MKTRKLLLFIAAMFFTGACLADEEAKTKLESGQNLPLPLPQIDHPYERIDRLFNALPSGGTLDRDKIVALVGEEIAAYLSAFEVHELISLDGKITISLLRDYSGVTPKGTRIQAAKEITLNYRREGGKIICEGIVGIKVKPRLLFIWLPVISLASRQGENGSTIMEAGLSTVLGTINHTVNLGPDGKPINSH